MLLVDSHCHLDRLSYGSKQTNMADVLAKAAEHYASAEAEAKKNQANLVVAEIYTEWAPLLFETDLDGAVEKLNVAVQFSAQVPEVATAAKRNLAIGLFKRGWRSIKGGKASEAVADFERALEFADLQVSTAGPTGRHRSGGLQDAHGARQRLMSYSRHGRGRWPVMTSLHERRPNNLWPRVMVRRARLAGLEAALARP